MGGMAQPNQTTQIIAKNQWYTIWREIDEGVRLIVKYTDRFDASIYAMRVVEIRGDTIHIYVKWNISPERRGERHTAVRLQPETVAQWRDRLLSVSSINDFNNLMWDLDDVINQAKEL
jgi:hypothetical protein